MDASEQRRVIEALILAAPDPISASRLAQVVPDLTPGDAKDLINALNAEYQEQDRAFEIWEVAGGYQIRTLAEFSGYLQQLRKERPLRLSHAALETLSIVAYKQPVTRGEVEMVRGVDTGAVLKSLLERRLVRILGHKEVPGRPLLYGTSKRFLEVFGLESIKQLPTLRELEELAREQGVELPGGDALEDLVSEDAADSGESAAPGEADAAGGEPSSAEIEADLASHDHPAGDAAEQVDLDDEAPRAASSIAEDAPSEGDEEPDPLLS